MQSSAENITPIVPTSPIEDRPPISIQRGSTRFQGRKIEAYANKLAVWEKSADCPNCAWRRVPYSEWGAPDSVPLKERRYYSLQTAHPWIARWRDPIDALKIGLSTLWEKVKRFCSGKDLFFLNKDIKEKAQQNVEKGVIPCGLKTNRGGFIKRGHAYLSLAVPTKTDQMLYLDIDPAITQLGPGYSPQLKPIIPKGLENTDAAMVTHAHKDHFKNTRLYKLFIQIPALCRRIANRIISIIKQKFPSFFEKTASDVVPEKPIRTRLCFPAGSEKIDSVFNNALDYQWEDGSTTGLRMNPFVSYTINQEDEEVATLAAIPTNHWAGTNPLTNFHKAPGYGYLVMTENECILDAGDTGYSADMYEAIKETAAQNPHENGPKYVTALFSPAGPDFNRKHMQKTHQATIDTARCITKLQLLPFIEAKATATSTTDKQTLLREFMTETECHFDHWGHYKLGPIHFEDPWICWLQLIHEVMGNNFDLSATGEGAVDLQSSLNDPAYKATLKSVKEQLFNDILALNGSSITTNDSVPPEQTTSSSSNALSSETEEHQEPGTQQPWNKLDITKILLKTLLTQVANHHETSFGHPQHEIVTDWILDNFENIDLERLTINNLLTWFFTHPDKRSASLLDTLFSRVDQTTTDV